MLRLLALVLSLLLAVAAWGTDLPSQISANTSLTLAASPYRLVTSTTIDAGVSVGVQAGVEVIASDGVRLFVNGTLTGTGTPTSPISFHHDDATSRGGWEGVYVAPTGRLTLSHATISNAVHDVMAPGGQVQLTSCTLSLASEDALFAWGACALTATGCSFSDNTGRGVYCEGYQVTGAVSSCLFSGNGGYPVQMKATVVEILGAGNSYVGNGTQRIGVSCSMVDDLTDTDTWVPQRIPYELGAGGGDTALTIAAGGRLNVSAGCLIYGTRVDCKGRLDVNGTPVAPAVLTAPPESTVRGAWEGIVGWTGSTCNLSHARVDYATTGLTADGVTLAMTGVVLGDCTYDGARVTGYSALTVTDCHFMRNGRNGLRLECPASTGSIENCEFAGNGSYPVWSLANDVARLRTGNTYRGNAVQAVGVGCGASPDLGSGSQTWVSQGVPLDCAAATTGTVLSIAGGASLTIGAGQTLYLGGLDVSGTLRVEASAANPCLFLPPGGDTTPGAWAGIRYLGGGGLLSGAFVSYAVNGLSISGGAPTVTECQLRDNQQDGVVCSSSATPVVTRCRIEGNGRHGVFVTSAARPNLGDLVSATTDDDGRNVLLGNGGHDVYNDTANNLSAQNNTWASIESAAIAARIYDKNDASTKGEVVFSPVYAPGVPVAPALRYTGAVGLVNDGVEPNQASPGAPTQFRVTYADAEGDAPVYVRLHVNHRTTPVEGSPFTLGLIGAATYATGAVFGADLQLAAGRDYRYWFEAADELMKATGPPTRPMPGPLVTTAPVLGFSPQAGYQTDGVSPDSGVGRTDFTFRCVYSDAEAEPPASIACHILCEGVPLVVSPVRMREADQGPYRTGRTYECSARLNPGGSYTYRFEATDGALAAVGPPAVAQSGPVVTAPAPVVTALAVQQVRADLVQVQWRQTEAAVAQVRVCNLAGRTVAVPCRSSHYTAGQATALWSRRLASGTRAPAGRYLMVLSISSGEGVHWEMTAPLQLR